MRRANCQSSMAVSRQRRKVTSPRKASAESTITWKAVVAPDRPCPLWKPRATSAAEVAPRKMLARPLVSLMVAARWVCRL